MALRCCWWWVALRYLALNHSALEEEVVDLNEELTRVASERAALAAQVGGISHGPQEKGDRWIMPQALRVPVPVPVSESES